MHLDAVARERVEQAVDGVVATHLDLQGAVVQMLEHETAELRQFGHPPLEVQHEGLGVELVEQGRHAGALGDLAPG